MRVLFGLEAHSAEHPCNHFLIFGAEPNFVQENPRLYELSLPELQALCHRYGALLIQAHPFRSMCALAELSALDGVEVYNGHPHHQSHDERALAVAETNPRLIRTSGSDFHEPDALARGGIVTDRDIHTSAELAQCLRDGAFTRIETRP